MRQTITRILLSIWVLFAWTGCATNNEKPVKSVNGNIEGFSFAFLTDVHLNKDNRGNGDEGLRMALEEVKKQNVDFVVFGGDNTDLDGMKPEEEGAADSLLSRFKMIAEASGIKTYYTIGNHDRYYTFEGQSDPEGFKLFGKHLGETYYSFDHKGVHFIVLNSVQTDPEHTYFINPVQMQWLKDDLGAIGEEMPVVVVTHVPFQSLYYPAVEGKIVSTDMMDNFKEVWDLLLTRDLKIILQGHQHLHEELFSKGTWFLTGGAVCAGWWNGAFHGTEEGYLLVNVDSENRFSWEYIDYGWEK